MQPIAANISVGIPSTVDPDRALNPEQRAHKLCINAADTAMLPTTATLQEIVDRPDLHTIGDLAALTDRLTNEMMLFSALVGHAMAGHRLSHYQIGPDAALVDALSCADAHQNDLHGEFVRELES